MSATEDMYYKSVLRLVTEAGSLVREAFRSSAPMAVETKSSAVDLVTATDKAVESLLVAGLSKEFPDHKFIGEESAEGRQQLTDAPTWIIDPIDGTTNFVHRLPFIAISVGLYINKKPNIGIIYNPILEQLFTARAGQGAYLNGFPIKCSGVKSVSKALIVSTFGSQRDPKLLDNYFHNTRAFVQNGCHGHRSFGSACVNLAYVANGGADSYLEIGLHCWDVAAGGLIIQEAGGYVMDPSGGPFDVMSRRILAAGSKELAEEISRIIRADVEMQRDD